MKINNNLYSWFFSFVISSFIFLWDVEFLFNGKYYDYDLRYFILILIIPIAVFLLKNIFNKNFLIELMARNKVFIIFFIFLFIHLFLVNLLNQVEIRQYNFKSIIFFILVSIIYIFNRDRVINNLNKIIIIFLSIYLLIFFFSFFIENDELVGFCSQKYVIYISNKIGTNFYPINNIIFQENSHLAMVLIGSLFYILYKGFQNFYYLLLFFIVFIVSIFYLSTTYLAGLILCGIVLSFYFYKKNINYKKLIFINFTLILVSSFFLLSDKNCSKKISDIKFNKLHKSNFFALGTLEEEYNPKNTTSTIYERSIKINIETFKNNFFGWGYSNNDIATEKFMAKNPRLSDIGQLHLLNTHDALGNLFKLINEFGIFIFFVFYYFLIYFFKKEKIEEHKIFFICIFLVQLFRGAGYINGGFCFAIIEILFCHKFAKK